MSGLHTMALFLLFGCSCSFVSLARTAETTVSQTADTTSGDWMTVNQSTLLPTDTEGPDPLLPVLTPITGGLEGNIQIKQNHTAYTTWGKWSSCSNRCEKQRSRRCVLAEVCKEDVERELRGCHREGKACGRQRPGSPGGPATSHSGMEAYDKLSRRQLDDVVYDLLYDDWSEWSACTRSCKRRRYRTCAIKRWCKDTLLLTEQNCYVPDTPCERKLLEASGKDESKETVTKKPHRPKVDKATTIRPSLPTDPYNPATCGEREEGPSLRIVGGRWARPGSWPWQVAILTRFREQYCGGVLIAPQYVLTAAHCLRNQGHRRRVYVRVGKHDLTKGDGPKADLRPAARYIHPDFDMDTIDSDIAVLKLERPVPVSRYTKYACVPEANETLAENTVCYAVGWGKMKNTHLYGTDVLREAAMPVVSHDKCQAAFDFLITGNQMCAGHKRGGTDTCAGDSGGPLMCQVEKGGVKRWYVYGVTSHGEGCGDKGKFGIYSRVTNFSQWIIEATHNG